MRFCIWEPVYVVEVPRLSLSWSLSHGLIAVFLYASCGVNFQWTNFKDTDFKNISIKINMQVTCNSPTRTEKILYVDVFSLVFFLFWEFCFLYNLEPWFFFLSSSRNGMVAFSFI